MTRRASGVTQGAPSVPPTPTLWPLTVSISPAGAGTVTGSGINAPTDPTEDYPDGSNAVLTAHPAAGYVFSSWTGGGVGGQTTPVTNPGVAMTQGRVVTANFALSSGPEVRKGVQVPLGKAAPQKATIAELNAMLTSSSAPGKRGGVRALVFGNPPYSTPVAYLQQIFDAGIKLIVMLDWDIGFTVAQYQNRMADLLSRIPSDYVEIGNEMGSPGQPAWDTGDLYWNAVRGVAGQIQAADRQPGDPTSGKRKALLGAPQDIDTNLFLTRAGQQGNIFSAVDGVCVHPYGQAGVGPANGPYPNATTMQRMFDAFSRVPAGKPLYITEMGWATASPEGFQGLTVDEATQAARLTQAYNQLYAKAAAWSIDWIGWYMDVDTWGLPGQQKWANYCGLKAWDGTNVIAKPSRAAFIGQPISQGR